MELITNSPVLTGQPLRASAAVISRPVRTERRQISRAKISLRMRVRTADFSDGCLEHVGNTLNASRTAFYFRAPLDRYYKGMRLRITFPYDSAAHTCMEELGEVVRVEPGATSHGVAVVRLPACHAAVCEGQAEERAERRSHRRFPFVAAIELPDARIGAPMQARTSDLSMSGCYIDTLNPAIPGTVLYFRMSKADEALEACAVVCTQHQGCGMGVVFQDLTAEQQAILKSLLGESDMPETPLETSSGEEILQTSGETTQSRLGRLVDILNQKGVLSHSEVAKVSPTQIVD